LNRAVWTPYALSNVQAIKADLAEFNPRAARAVAERLVEAGNGLALFPHRGRPVPGTDMRELVSVNPCIIRDRVTRDEVAILRGRHSARRPTKP
jgi:plasmid stabilization system protein ParE